MRTLFEHVWTWWLWTSLMITIFWRWWSTMGQWDCDDSPIFQKCTLEPRIFAQTKGPTCVFRSKPEYRRLNLAIDALRGVFSHRKQGQHRHVYGSDHSCLGNPSEFRPAIPVPSKRPYKTQRNRVNWLEFLMKFEWFIFMYPSCQAPMMPRTPLITLLWTPLFSRNPWRPGKKNCGMSICLDDLRIKQNLGLESYEKSDVNPRVEDSAGPFHVQTQTFHAFSREILCQAHLDKARAQRATVNASGAVREIQRSQGTASKFGGLRIFWSHQHVES